MANTVIGIFENESDAQKAQNYLLENGYADGDVDIKIASYKSQTGSIDTNAKEDDFFGKIGNFFKDLFGENEHEAQLYSEAGKRGTIVTVHALSTGEAEAAADILDQFGAVDVTEDAARHSSGQVFTDGAFSGEGIPGDARRDGAPDITANEPYARNSPADPLPMSQQEEGLGSDEPRNPEQRSRSRIFERSLEDDIRLRQQIPSNDQTPFGRGSEDPDLQSYRDIDQTLSGNDQLLNDEDRTQQADTSKLTDEERLRRLNLGL